MYQQYCEEIYRFIAGYAISDKPLVEQAAIQFGADAFSYYVASRKDEAAKIGPKAFTSMLP